MPRPRARIPQLSLVGVREPSSQLFQDAPPGGAAPLPGGDAGDAQALLLTWEDAWRAASAPAVASPSSPLPSATAAAALARAAPPRVAPLLASLFRAPLALAAGGAAAHAACALAAPMLLRATLARMDEIDGPPWSEARRRSARALSLSALR
jgi:hypothetical protein